ncbi:MAG: topoisomerase IV, partial [Synechococcaceae bacterium WB6_3A_227]|nr:topoisomerase IV [Synechococcaceae bacterium WB6_3A_227]
RKCARVVGDVLGKYHPHGDQAVYDALVRLVQTFASRHPLLDGHGNFGSVDDDPAAAMRYTETRLSPLSHRGMLDEIGSDTIDFANNFDGSQQEPTVLPAQLPFLLLNGCSGIAVGMATSIPPHNLGEVVDGLIALLRNPELSDQKLLELIPGPDFPTGGVVLTGSGLRDTYLQGRGSIPMRGVAHIEETQPGKGRHKRGAVVITELPYQLSKAGWIEKLAEQVNEGKITGIADIRDESDREGMRVVVELRRDANAEQVMAELHKRTALQSNFGAIMLALVHGKPQQLSLRQLLEQFLEYRELTMVRRTRYALKRCEDRLEVVEGLIKALNVLREVIEMIQSARDSASAKASLQVQLDLTERQAEAVLAMPLRRLTGLEQESLRKELEELRQEQKELRHLLDDRPALLDTLVKELKQLRKQFATPRRTRLQEGGDDLVAQRAAAQRPNAEAQRLHALAAISSDNRLLLQSDGLLRIASPQSLGKLHLSGPLPFGDHGAHGQLIMAVQPAPTLLAFTSGGRVAALRWEFAAQQPGPIEKFLPESVDGQGEKVVEVLVLPPEDINFSIGLLSSDGRFKRIAAEEFRELSGRATTVLKLKDGVVLERAVICKETDNLIVASSTGRSLRLPIDDNNVPLMGRTAQGPTLMRLLPGETIVGAAVTAADAEVLLISALGQLKKLAVSNLRLCERGDLGEIALKFSNRNDQLVDLRACDVELVAVETQTGSIRLQTDSLLAEDSRGTGLNLELPKTEKVTRLLPLNNQL